jgi:hypothetical protein
MNHGDTATRRKIFFNHGEHGEHGESKSMRDFPRVPRVPRGNTAFDLRRAAVVK